MKRRGNSRRVVSSSRKEQSQSACSECSEGNAGCKLAAEFLPSDRNNPNRKARLKTGPGTLY